MEEDLLEILQAEKEGLTYRELLKKLKLSKHNNKEELKEQLADQEKKGSIFLTEEEKYIIMPNNYSVATLNEITKNKLYFQDQNNTLDFIYHENLNGAILEDTVILTLNDNNEYEVVKILERKNPNVICEVQSIEGIKHLIPYSYSQDMKVRISSIDMKKLVEGDRILIKTSLDKCDEYYEADFIKKIGHRDDPDINNKCIIINNGFQLDFSEEAMQEVKALPTEVNSAEIGDRLDLRNIEVFTIDCDGCKDMDDAVSLTEDEHGNYVLGVHIANVTHYIKPKMQLYKEMKDRATSVYTAGSVVPMLPHEISNGICSLHPEVDRLTKSCIMIFNKRGELLEYNILDSIINSQKKMTYSEVNEILDSGQVINDYEPFIKTLHKMNELSQILERKRDKEGYLSFDSNELKIHLDENKNPEKFEVIKQERAQKIIENFMIAANECVATHLKCMNLPTVYRVHANPDEERIESTIAFLKSLGYKIRGNNGIYDNNFYQKILQEFSDKPEFSVLSNLLLRSMKRAKYSIENNGHFGLGLNNYTHFTAPIRRFPDYEVHSLLDNYHSENILGFMDDNLEKMLAEDCQHASLKERAADQAEKDYNKELMIQYMSQHINESFVGMITDIHSKRILVKTNEMIEGIVRPKDMDGIFTYQPKNHSLKESESNNIYKIGHEVLLINIGISEDRQEVCFAIEKNLTLEQKRGKTKQKVNNRVS